jgi:hypothetical protein
MTRGIEAILAAVERMESVKLEIDEVRRSAGVRVGARVVARIDLRRDGEVQINAPQDAISLLQRTFPSARPSASGVVFDLPDPENESAALAAIRRRVDVEKLAWQFRAQSP